MAGMPPKHRGVWYRFYFGGYYLLLSGTRAVEGAPVATLADLNLSRVRRAKDPILTDSVVRVKRTTLGWDFDWASTKERNWVLSLAGEISAEELIENFMLDEERDYAAVH